ncbi:hypothetical protein NMG60_11005684 [Bertholletia excelsa]
MSSNQTHLTNTAHKTCSHKYPSAIPQKSSHLRHFTVPKEQCISPVYVGFLGLCLGQSFHRENRESREPSPSPFFLYYFLQRLLSFSLIYFLSVLSSSYT